MSTPAAALPGAWDYEALAALVRDERLPLVVVDLDVFETNVRRLVGIAAAHGKLLRPASKSVRVPELLRIIAQVGAPTVRGVMCYSVDEASLLAAAQGSFSAVVERALADDPAKAGYLAVLQPVASFDDSELWLRLPSVVAAVVAAVAAYRLGRRLAGRYAGAAASLFRGRRAP